jgi:hypothetical protein
MAKSYRQISDKDASRGAKAAAGNLKKVAKKVEKLSKEGKTMAAARAFMKQLGRSIKVKDKNTKNRVTALFKVKGESFSKSSYKTKAGKKAGGINARNNKQVSGQIAAQTLGTRAAAKGIINFKIGKGKNAMTFDKAMKTLYGKAGASRATAIRVGLGSRKAPANVRTRAPRPPSAGRGKGGKGKK